MSDGKPAGPTHRCFAISSRCALPAPRLRIALAARPAEAIGALLPLLGCGEEAAAIAFDGLADRGHDDPMAIRALRVIAEEERVHDSLIGQMRDALPASIEAAGLLARSRRFHVRLMHGGTALHLARIAALDSAVCLILSSLLRGHGPLTADRVIAPILHRIRADEARHVRLSRGLALEAGATAVMRHQAAAARGALADILALVSAPFEELGVDFAALDRDLRCLPDGLLKA